MNRTTITLNVGKIEDEIKTIGNRNFYRFSGAYQAKKDGPTTWYDVLYPTDGHEKFFTDVLPRLRSVLVEGQVSASAYKDKEGNAKPSLSIWAYTVEVMTWKDRDNSNTDTSSPAQEEDTPF